MEIEIEEKDVRKTINRFNSISYNLINSSISNYDGLLASFIKFLQEDRIIQEFIKKCGEADEKLVERFLTDHTWRAQLSLGSSIEKQVSNTFSILKFIVENNIQKEDIIISFSRGKSVQEHLDGFKHQVIETLIFPIKQHIEEVCIDNGYDIQKMIQQITISGNYGNMNVAAGNNATATFQNNSIDQNKLNELIKNILEKIDGLSEKDKEIIESSLERIKVEITSEKPKSGILSSAFKAIKLIKHSGEFFMAVFALEDFIRRCFPF